MVEVNDRFARRLLNWARSIAPEPMSFEDPLWMMESVGMGSGGMERAREAWATASILWQDEDDAFEFLTRKHAMMEDERPVIIAIRSGEGLRAVNNLIGRLRYGSAA